jgi:hypothetical protein
VFVSFASADNSRTKFPEGEISRFVSHLRQMFAQVSGKRLGKEFDFFLSCANIPAGDHWVSTLNRELSRADVFLPIFSPSFFNSEWCAKEWGAFIGRFSARPRRARLPYGLVVPVPWMSCCPLPPVAEKIQLAGGDDGACGMRRLMVSEPQRYDEELEELARRLRQGADEPRPAWGPDVDVARAKPAFPEKEEWLWGPRYVFLRVSATKGRRRETEGNGDGPNRQQYRYYSLAAPGRDS